MNTWLRKNLKGSMSFYSHIPCRMREYVLLRMTNGLTGSS